MTWTTDLRLKPGKATTLKNRQLQIAAMLDRFLPKVPPPSLRKAMAVPQRRLP